MKIIDIYLQKKRYNPRVRATIPGAWVVVLESGTEIPVSPEWDSRVTALNNAKNMGFVIGGALL